MELLRVLCVNIKRGLGGVGIFLVNLNFVVLLLVELLIMGFWFLFVE